MKTGKSIVELATEIQRQAEAKRDFVVDTAALQMVANEGDKLSLEFGDQVLAIGGTAHDQIAANVGIPKK
jgi:3-oxoacyl-ACP reductase-like protein